MTTQGFVVTHAKDAQFERGLRSFFEYRDLGLKQATQGRVTASVIRAAGGHEFSSQPHLHHTEFQLVYVLKGWIEFEYEGAGSGSAGGRLLCAPTAWDSPPRTGAQR